MKLIEVSLTDNKLTTLELSEEQFAEQIDYFTSRGPVTKIGNMIVMRDDTFPKQDRVYLMFR